MKDGPLAKRWRCDRIGDTRGRHRCCDLFVLDLDHDPLAIPAAIHYAMAAARTHPQLAADLIEQALSKVPQHGAELARVFTPTMVEGARRILEVLLEKLAGEDG